MAKLYVFGIGGTGSRVIKSLTLLLASGIEANGHDIVPIIIDPDIANGDVTRTIELLKNYRQVRNQRYLDFSNDSNKFYKNKIEPLENNEDNFRMPLNGVSDNKFKDYIDYGTLDRKNKALASLLFSEDNLEAKMDVGFKGNPNIGSVVLNQFVDSPYFKQFAASFQEGDRIFIVSSIFGGTGAAGFPLILKNLRELADPFPNCALIKRAPVGAITVLPYFGVTTDTNSKIDSSTFISKTKAALTYYNKNVSGNRSLNALYYIGDQMKKDYTNNEGSIAQKNDAHFVELAAALAILDFAHTSAGSLRNRLERIPDGDTERIVAERLHYKDFGIKRNAPEVTFDVLADITQQQLKKSLTQYLLFVKYQREYIKTGLTKAWAKDNRFDEMFLGELFYGSYLRNVNGYFIEWLQELERNDRAFCPFNLNTEANNLFNLVKNVKPKFSFTNNYNLFDSELNGVKDSNTQKEQKFMALFYQATAQLVKNKFNFK